MPPAANIDEAIELIPSNVIGKAGTLLAAMNTWLVVFDEAQPPFPAPGAPLDATNREQRSVRDWFGPSILARDQIDITTLGLQEQSLSRVMEVLFRALQAVKYAQIAGRITADQETSVVTQYNAAWA